MANHYEVLGLKRGSSAQEIRSAYRRLVLVHHPDRSKDPKTSALFIKITEAYEVLTNDERRQEYDLRLKAEDERWQQAQSNARKFSNPSPKKQVKPTSTLNADLTRLANMFSRGRIQEAELLARQLTKSAPQEALPYGILGDILRARGSLVEAAKMYAYAAQFDPRNPLYHRLHAELIDAARTSDSPIHIARDREAKPGPLLFASFIACVAGVYVVLGREQPMVSGISVISTFTLGLVGILFFSGVATGAAFSLGGWLDRYDSIATNSLGRRSPTATLGFVALVNFWAAAFLYLFIGFAQRSFNYSTSRMVGVVALLTVFFSACAIPSYAIESPQVLLWGGNFIYLGSLLGWLVADAFREP
ncbi:MAG TPA: DnaJ domain-containing protein [Fimbriimonadaceae bacterium]|nr:DnaJ domain-containing protein [Fimbriimonadaceae bacterium]